MEAVQQVSTRSHLLTQLRFIFFRDVFVAMRLSTDS